MSYTSRVKSSTYPSQSGNNPEIKLIGHLISTEDVHLVKYSAYSGFTIEDEDNVHSLSFSSAYSSSL